MEAEKVGHYTRKPQSVKSERTWTREGRNTLHPPRGSGHADKRGRKQKHESAKPVSDEGMTNAIA